MQSVWAESPWCPSNPEFIRRINGLNSIDEVRNIVFEAEYLVMGLGDVYLGAPVAVPLDPRHRLVTTKYNPARTWTPQNAVGIGGAYLCIYGMEGPGGYQFVGRTCQVWNTYNRTRDFAEQPYLLRFFDRIRFYPVSPEELLEFRRDFLAGRVGLRVEKEEFSLTGYDAYLSENSAAIAAFKSRQQSAFEAERERWKSLPQPVQEEAGAATVEEEELPDIAEAAPSPLHGNVWIVRVGEGDRVRDGDDLLILEAMKMEVAVQAPADGVVMKLLVEPGAAVTPGRNLVILDIR